MREEQLDRDDPNQRRAHNSLPPRPPSSWRLTRQACRASPRQQGDLLHTARLCRPGYAHHPHTTRPTQPVGGRRRHDRVSPRPCPFRFGKYALNMDHLPDPLDPQSLPFEQAL